MDVKSAFLQCELEEEVFMIRLPSFESSKHSIAVWQLKKLLYGLKYVCGMMDYGLMYKLDMIIRLKGYTNADWGGYKVDRRSTSGFVFSLGNGAISWSRKKQPTLEYGGQI